VKSGAPPFPDFAALNPGYELNTPSRSRDSFFARVLQSSFDPVRARGMSGVRCTRGSGKKCQGSATGSPVSRRHSLCNGFTACSVLSPLTGLFRHRRLRVRVANLTPASGRQDHAASPTPHRHSSARSRARRRCLGQTGKSGIGFGGSTTKILSFLNKSATHDHSSTRNVQKPVSSRCQLTNTSSGLSGISSCILDARSVALR
jgi:hypothetical protein